MKLFESVVIAALLHDIGEFYQKGQQVSLVDNKGKHPEVSKKFIDIFSDLFSKAADSQLVADLVKRHHENSQAFNQELLVQFADEGIKPLAQLICVADNLSSKEKDIENDEYRNHRTCPLVSVFSSIKADDREAGELFSYHLEDFKPEKCFPDFKLKELIPSDITKHINNFTAELLLLQKAGPKDFNELIVSLDTFLQKYLWCIPSSAFDRIPDVSLYDHMRTTAAIAAAMFRYHQSADDFTLRSIKNLKNMKFKLLLADFSGIQQYIFAIAKTGASGVAKRLRARSFFVNTLLDVIAHYFLEKFNLPLCNIMLSSGGKFYILLPNISGSNKLIQDVKQELNDYMYEQFKSAVSINIASIDICGEDFNSFDNSLVMLSRQLSLEKHRQHENVLISNEVWNEDTFILENNLAGKIVCPICGSTFIYNNLDQCQLCKKDENIGSRLANAAYIGFSRNAGDFHIFSNYYITISDSLIYGDYYLINILNNCTLPENVYGYPISIKYATNNVPVFDEGINTGNIMTFKDIADKAIGVKHLGVLKADVDNLGFLFLEGLKNKEENRYTVSRVATFSRMLDIFFTGYVNKILKDSFKEVYSVFSGGDDLFLIGPWDMMADLALRIKQEFARFTGNNPDFTLSAAIFLARSRSHIANMAEQAEEKLKEAKQHKNERLYPGLDGRNSIWFMNELFLWDDYEKYLEKAKQIEKWILEESVKITALTRLANYGKRYQHFLKTIDFDDLRFIPMLAYDIKRNYAPYKDKDANSKKLYDWVSKLRKDIENLCLVKKEMHFLNFCISYALNKTREERENDTIPK